MTAIEAREILDQAKKKSFTAEIPQERAYTYKYVDSIALDELQEIIWDMLTKKIERSPNEYRNI